MVSQIINPSGSEQHQIPSLTSPTFKMKDYGLETKKSQDCKCEEGTNRYDCEDKTDFYPLLSFHLLEDEGAKNIGILSGRT